MDEGKVIIEAKDSGGVRIALSLRRMGTSG